MSNGDIVKIWWSNINVQDTDIVAFYTPVTEPPLSYLDFRFVKTTVNHGSYMRRN